MVLHALMAGEQIAVGVVVPGEVVSVGGISSGRSRVGIDVAPAERWKVAWHCGRGV
jgi:hypothetical protein